MNPNLIRIVIAAFLAVHGLVHVSMTLVPLSKPGEIRTPFWPGWWRSATDPAWLAVRAGLSNELVRGLGCALWLAAAAGFGLAGLGLLGVPGLGAIWAPASGVGCGASLLLLALYWHPWMVAAVVINLVIAGGLALQLPKYLF